MPPANSNPNPNTEPFETFFRGWLVRQEEVRQLLLQATTERDCDKAREDEEARLQGLIGRVVAHYAEYYKAKLRVVREDALIMFEPPWFTLFERNLLWIGGFKPGLALRLVRNYVTNLTEEQTRMMEDVRTEMAEEERELAAELEKVKTGPTMISLVEMATRGESGRMEKGMSFSSEFATGDCREKLRAAMTMGATRDAFNFILRFKF
ncbi:Protein DOG1-like 4 [Vitis vinifera]|uniref:Protein DOG1-like 4 n=1 Tax=Vitis vinifera TaxID=29760 RepID=A0A438J2B0_VITVI|nr:Protein DOG1-like 4 [Vitis vinifera]